jgi:hypothetical protein
VTPLVYRNEMAGQARRRIGVVLIAMSLGACSAPSGSPSASDMASPTGPTAPSSTTSPSAGLTEAPGTSSNPSPGPTTGPLEGFVAIPPTEGTLNAILVQDGTVVVGGFQGPGATPSIRVLTGGTWTAASIPDATGQVTGIVDFGDRLLAVGNTLPETRSGFIWESADGQVWRPVETLEDASLDGIAVGGGVALAIGARLDPEMNATASAWRSTDGTTWRRSSVSGAGDAAMRSIEATSSGFAAIGHRRLGQPRPFWTTADGQRWAAVDNDLDDQLLTIDVIARRDGYLIVGASGRSGDQHPFQATSSDGARWQRTNLSAAEGYASAVALAMDRIVIAGVDADRHTHWWEADGMWQTVTYEPSGATIPALWWDPTNGLIGVGSRNGLQATWAFEGP